MTGQVNKIFDELESSTSIKLSKKLLVYNFSETDEEFQQNRKDFFLESNFENDLGLSSLFQDFRQRTQHCVGPGVVDK